NDTATTEIYTLSLHDALPISVVAVSLREIFLDDVVLRRALEFAALDILFVGKRDIERKQPSRSRIDGHRRVHAAERNGLEQRTHVTEGGDRNSALPDLSLGAGMTVS